MSFLSGHRLWNQLDSCTQEPELIHYGSAAANSEKRVNISSLVKQVKRTDDGDVLVTLEQQRIRKEQHVKQRAAAGRESERDDDFHMLLTASRTEGIMTDST